MTELRTVGVEEEMLLVERSTGHAISLQSQVLAAMPEDPPEGEIEGEFAREQIEVGSAPHDDLATLAAELTEWRRRASVAARRQGAAVAALGLSPTPTVPHRAQGDRYARMAERFGVIAAEFLSCGCHVHVSVRDREEAVRVLDRIRPSLPLLTALCTNSPFHAGVDTGYAGYRTLQMDRWPSAGPVEPFGSAAAYDEAMAQMLATGVLLDQGMVYFDARVSHRYPTIEIRVADVCLDVRDAVLLAALCRALVETEAHDARDAVLPSVPVLRLARWQAASTGVGGDLLDPRTLTPVPAWEAIGALVERLRPALERSGDVGLVEGALARIRRGGTGADRQRRVLEHTGSMADVVADATRVTTGTERDQF